MIKTSQDFKHVYKIFEKISENVLAKYADECDRNNRFPVESLDALKDQQMLALLIPKKYGGFGLNFYEYQQCLSRLAQSCASTAASYNMHNIVIGSISNYNLDKFPSDTRQRLEQNLLYIYKLVVEDKKVFAAATTEPGIGARFSQVKTTFERVGEFYILNGKKTFVTMATYADYFLVLANKKLNSNEACNGQWLTYFLVPRIADGVTVIKTWDVLGMRGTSSQEVIFDQVKLPHEAVFMGREGFALSKVMREPHWITGGYLGVYLGIMEAIFNFTREYIQSRSDYINKSGLAYSPLIQARIGEMFTLLNNARLNVYEAAKRVDLNPEASESQRAIYSAKYVLGETMPKLATMALRTCGGSSIHKKFPLERHLRDSCCGGLMPAVSDMCQMFLGQSVLEMTNIDIW